MVTKETGIDPKVKILREDIDKLTEYAQNGLIEHGCMDEQTIILGEKIKILKAVNEKLKRELRAQNQRWVEPEAEK